MLDEYGYATRIEDDALVFGNCPFSALLDGGTKLICTMSIDVIRGVIDGCGRPKITAGFIPGFAVGPGRCCVRVAGVARASK